MKPTFLSLERTATNDKPFRLTHDDIIFEEANFHIYTNDAYYGNGALQDASIGASDVIFFKNGNLKDIFFKNRTAGQNTKIVVNCTLKV